MKCEAGWSTSWNQDCWDRNINDLRYADDTTLMAESEEELKSFLWRWKQSWKAGLKFNIQKMKMMASSPITSWQIDRETMETVTDLIFLGSKIIVDIDSDCSHEIKRHLFLGRKALTNWDSILKTSLLLTEVCLVKAMVSPVVMYGCESWTTKKAEHQRTDAF